MKPISDIKSSFCRDFKDPLVKWFCRTSGTDSNKDVSISETMDEHTEKLFGNVSVFNASTIKPSKDTLLDISENIGNFLYEISPSDSHDRSMWHFFGNCILAIQERETFIPCFHDFTDDFCYGVPNNCTYSICFCHFPLFWDGISVRYPLSSFRPTETN